MAKDVKQMQKKVHMKSTTLDNGVEYKHHEQWGLPTFFADAHSPWQKPIVENSIGLARRWFFPKGTDWAQITEEEFQNALTILNKKISQVAQLSKRPRSREGAWHYEKSAEKMSMQFTREFTFKRSRIK